MISLYPTQTSQKAQTAPLKNSGPIRLYSDTPAPASSAPSTKGVPITQPVTPPKSVGGTPQVEAMSPALKLPTPKGITQPIKSSYGASNLSDSSSGKPLLTYENPQAKSSQLLSDRTALPFDPMVAQKIDPSILQNGRMPQSVSQAIKASIPNAVFNELDHIMPLELGGSNLKGNLQLEPAANTSKPYSPGSNPTATDSLENKLAAQVHSGKISLVDGWKLMAKAKGLTLPEEGGPVPSGAGAKPLMPSSATNNDFKKPGLDSNISVGSKTTPLDMGAAKGAIDKEVGVNWATHPVQSAKELYSNVKKDIDTTIQNLITNTVQFKSDVLSNTNRTGSEKVGTTLNLLHSMANLVLLPVSETYSIASQLPVIKPAADAIGVIFGTAGKILAFDAGQLLSVVPGLSEANKAALQEPIENVASLAGQILLGGFVYEKITGLMEAKGSITPEDIKATIKEAEQHAEYIKSLPAPKESPKLSTPEQPLLEAPKKQSSVTGDGFTMSDKADKGIVAKSKAISSYKEELEKYNANPTEAQKIKVLKAKEVKDNLLNPNEEIIQPKAPTVSPKLAQTIETVRSITTTKSEVAPIETTSGFAVEPKAPSEEIIQPKTKITSLKPIEGTGETKIRGLSEGVEAKAIQNKLTDSFGDLPDYKTVNIKEQAQKASDLISKDYEAARAIAVGEKSAPKGVVPEAVYIAVENRAIAEGDIQTLKDLANSKLATEATTMGQRIRTLAERDPESPSIKIKEIQEAREKAVSERAKKSVIEAKEDVVQQVKEHIQRASARPRDWKSFVESITC